MSRIYLFAILLVSVLIQGCSESEPPAPVDMTFETPTIQELAPEDQEKVTQSIGALVQNCPLLTKYWGDIEFAKADIVPVYTSTLRSAKQVRIELKIHDLAKQIPYDFYARGHHCFYAVGPEDGDGPIGMTIGKKPCVKLCGLGAKSYAFLELPSLTPTFQVSPFIEHQPADPVLTKKPTADNQYDPIRIKEEVSADTEQFKLSLWLIDDDSEFAIGDEEELLRISVSNTKAELIYELTDLDSATAALSLCQKFGEIGFNHQPEVRVLLKQHLQEAWKTHMPQQFSFSTIDYQVGILPFRGDAHKLECSISSGV